MKGDTSLKYVTSNQDNLVPGDVWLDTQCLCVQVESVNADESETLCQETSILSCMVLWKMFKTNMETPK